MPDAIGHPRTEGMPPDTPKIMSGVVHDTTTYFGEVPKKDDAEAKEHILATNKIEVVMLTVE